nr:hypothetical protein [Tanacetum cinerariifolium]
MIVNEQLSQGEGPTSLIRTQHIPTVIETSPQLQNISNTYRKTRTGTKRIGIRIPQSNVPTSVVDEAITKEMHDGLGTATTTASSLEAEKGSGSPIQARPERLSNLPNEPPLGEGNTSRSGEGKDEEASLDKEDSPKQGRMIKEIDENENVNLVKSSKQGEAHEIVGHRIKSDDTKVVDFSTASPQKDNDEITLIETLVNIKKSATKDKGKAIMQGFKPPKKIKKKEMIQISLDEEIAQRFYEEETMESIRNFVPMESEGQIADSNAGEESSKEGESLKRPAEEELGQEQQKKQKKIIRVGNITEVHQLFVDMIKAFDIEDLVKLWSLVKERFSSSNPNKDKEIALWIELKRLFEPDEDDELWKFKSLELIWRLYDLCGMHNISIRDGQDIFMLVEKEYPLSRGVLLMMLVQKIQVDEHNEMAEEFQRKIFMQAERPRK